MSSNNYPEWDIDSMCANIPLPTRGEFNKQYSQPCTPAEQQCANRMPTGYERAPDLEYSLECKTDKRRLDNSSATLIAFDSLEHITKEGNQEAGALLIEIQGKEVWLPKKLCSNLNLENQTVRVWTPFLEDSKPDLLDMIDMIDDAKGDE